MSNIKIGSIELDDWYYVEPNVCAKDSADFANDHTFVEISESGQTYCMWTVGKLTELQFICPSLLSDAKSFDEAKKIVDEFLIRMSTILAFA